MKNAAPKPASRGRPPESKGEARREHILDNTLTLFAGQGIAATTIAQVARTTGVTPAVVHYYFGNRDGLIDAVVTERLASAINYIWNEFSEDTLLEPQSIITAFVDRLFTVVERMPQLPFLWSREILNAGGLLRTRVIGLIPQKKLEMFIRLFTRFQQSGKLNPQIAPALIIPSVMSLVLLPLAAQDILDKVPVFPALDKTLLHRHAIALTLNGLYPQQTQEQLK